jgi:tetratricopeptide (TPR) repeat protein
VQHLWSRGKIMRHTVLGVAAALLLAFAGLTFAQQRYYQDDLAFYQRAIHVNPANGTAYSALGDIYLDQGRTDMALAAHRKAHELAPNDAQVTLLLARALFAVKNYGEAEIVLQELLKNPRLGTTHQIPARLSLANVEIELQHLDAAQELLAQVEADDPVAPELHWAKAILFQREGLFRQAQAEYEREYQITGDPAARRQALILAKKNLPPAGSTHPPVPQVSVP